MLQINTGKLFRHGIDRVNQLRGIVYSNTKLPRDRKLATTCGILLETEASPRSRALVYELEERIELGKKGPGVLVSHTVTPFLQDFSAVASFGLNITMTPDAGLTERLIGGQAGLASYHPPREFIKRVFDEDVWLTADECLDFEQFVSRLLGLHRNTFLTVMRAIRSYVAALHRIRDDLPLAYTMFVAAVESLAKDFDGYESGWDDVDDRKRRPMEIALRGAAPDVRKKVKAVIVEVEHASLGRRYREFVSKHLDPSYFRDTATSTGRLLARVDLAEALRQAYRLRSRYIHELKGLPDELMMPHEHGETVFVDRQATLTFQGLSRLTRHVIIEFVKRAETVESEPYDYILEQSGIVSLPMAAQYWVWKPLRSSREARQRLEGFLEQYASVLAGEPGAVITDLRKMLKGAVQLMPDATKADRAALLALYGLFNLILSPHQRMRGYRKILATYDRDTAALTSETLIARTLLRTEKGWSLENHQKAHDRYLSQRGKKNGLHAPRLFDAAISLALAERFREMGDAEQAIRLVASAVENCPGHSALMAFENGFHKDQAIHWRDILLPKTPEGQSTNR